MRSSFAPTVGLALLALALAPGLDLPSARASAQDRDVELLGRIHGTRPPEAYYELRARDPQAFRMARGMSAGRGLPASGVRAGGARLRAEGGPAGVALGTRVVQGRFRFPVLLGLFADSPAEPFTRAQVQAHFFDGPNSTGTITDLYREMSGGLVDLSADVRSWVRSTLPRESVTNGSSGLGGSARVGEFVMELLARQPPTVDWGRYDNDGPDGIPNSGDDDGYVDVLAVVHPTSGAECGGGGQGSRVWSHKWRLTEAVGQEFVTASRTPSGRRIRVDDYTIQPARSCSGEGLNEIGVFAHELGHGFGLPDLYADGHAGAGRWDLMGQGSWGCSVRFEPERPCHMGAWSKAMLGWLQVDVLPFGSGWIPVALDPVERGRRAIAIPAGDGSGEYFLLENRQRIGFDGALAETGLLVWHVDPWLVEQRIDLNEVNENGSRMGVWLRQADGLNQLGLSGSLGGNRGDAGDPFTGEPGRNAFHAGTEPAAFTNLKPPSEQSTRGLPRSSSAGVTVLDIARSGDVLSFRVLPRYQTLHVRSRGEEGASGLFTVDGTALAGAETVLRSAPFQTHTIEAAPGALLGEGIRRGFSGWDDAPAAARVRSWTTGFEDAQLVAAYGGPREVRLSVALEADGASVAPGTLTTMPASPDLWFDEGTEVALRADPITGFAFRSWGGAAAGQPNPALLRMDQPKDATATFEQAFGLGTGALVQLPAGTSQEIRLEALHANLPVRWTLRSGTLPEGLRLDADGVLAGEALETGEFPLELELEDAIGLRASGTVTIAVTVPVLATSALAAPFLLEPGSLTEGQRRWLDRAGNDDGAYDLGDFRAYLLANPQASR